MPLVPTSSLYILMAQRTSYLMSLWVQEVLRLWLFLRVDGKQIWRYDSEMPKT